MIELLDVTKKFGGITALDGITLKMVGRVAIVGPRGSGKTTLIRLILGLLKPTSGRVSVMGVNPAERDKLAGKISYVPEKTAVYEKMTAAEYLNFFATLRGIEVDIREILTEYDVKRADDMISTFSKGMKRRLEVARALMGNPEILVLDEPFSGIDPESEIRIREAISKSRTKLVVVTGQATQEVEEIAKRVVVIRNGRVVFHGSVEKLAKL